jgi:biotin carboxylase
MGCEPVIVVGTTPDYVRKIYNKYPETVLFVLDLRFQGDPFLEGIEKSALLFSSLEDFEQTMHVVDLNLSTNNVSPQGVACFDCESLIPAARLAHHLRLPFPSLEAIAHARNKFEARSLWKKAGILTPAAAIASNLNETLDFFRCIKRTMVLKPVSGSGSELVFKCDDEEEIKRAVRIMKDELLRREANPLFRPIPIPSKTIPIDPCRSWIVEEFVSGPEFSCDFMFQNGQIMILRETGKIKALDQLFGSVLAYTFPPSYPERFSGENLFYVLKRAAVSLGFIWGHFMADFIIPDDGLPVIIEMTPRPGGDSIPDLVEIATGYDLLGMHLHIMSGKFEPPEEFSMPPESFASINFFAPKEGKIIYLDTSRIFPLPWVKAMVLKKNVGDRIVFPPADYDNRLLGYCIVSLDLNSDLFSVSQYLQSLFKISIV